MRKKLAYVGRPAAAPMLEPKAILNALVSPVIVLDEEGFVAQVNGSTEDFFEVSESHLLGVELCDLLPGDSPLFSVIDADDKTVMKIPVQGSTSGSTMEGKAPFKVRFSVATKSKDVTFPFELKDLPLP